MHQTPVEASQKSCGSVINVKSRARTNASRTNLNIPLPRHGKLQIPFPYEHVPRWPHPLQIVPFSPGMTESRGISSRSRKGVPRNTLLFLEFELFCFQAYLPRGVVFTVSPPGHDVMCPRNHKKKSARVLWGGGEFPILW